MMSCQSVIFCLFGADIVWCNWTRTVWGDRMMMETHNVTVFLGS